MSSFTGIFSTSLPTLMIVPYGTRQSKLDSFYVTNSPLSVTKKAELAKFYLNSQVLMIIPQGMGQLVQLVRLNKVLIVSMSQIVLYVLLT